MNAVDRSGKLQNAAEGGPKKSKLYDCIVIGGGPAGLSAAVYMGRMRRSTLVIDDKEGRSTWHQVNRNYLGFPDGIHATSLRELGEAQARRYGAEFVNARADRASVRGHGTERRFTISTTAGDFVSKTLIFAMGVTDNFPEFEGSMDCLGRSMFWCIICDGHEAIGKRVVVLGHGDRAASLALQLLVFTDKVTLVAWDEKLDVEEAAPSGAARSWDTVHNCGCQVYTCGKVGELASIQLQDGTEIPLDMLFVAQWIAPNTQLAKQLGVELDEHGYIITDAEQLTNIEAVYAAGDMTKLFNHQVTSAVHEGGMAAAAANYYLYEDWQKE